MNENNDLNKNIRTWSLFSGLKDEDYLVLEKYVKVIDFDKDEVVFRPNDPADVMYYMVSGTIKISKLMPDGKAQILYIYNADDFVGGLNILSGDHYLYLGETLEASKIGYIPKKIFSKYVLTNTQSLHSFIEKSYDRIRWAEELISRLSSSNAEIKVAGLLISLIDSYGNKKGDDIYLNLAITREEMGSYAGLTRDTMTRKLNEFKKRGIIDFRGNNIIIIKDLKALRSIIYLV